MAIRDEYQQIEAEIKKKEERNSILDLLSVGVTESQKAHISYEAWLYHKTGHDLGDTISTIVSSFCKILEQEEKFLDKSEIEEIINLDKFKSLEAPFEFINYSDFQLHIDFLLTVLNHILKKRLSATNSVGNYDSDIVEKIRSTIKLCEDLLDQCKNVDIDTIPFDLIKKYQQDSFLKEKDYFYEHYNNVILWIKDTRNLSKIEFEHYCEELSERSYYYRIEYIILNLIFYFLLFDDESRYVQLYIMMSKRLELTNPFVAINESYPVPNHTIADIFNLFKKFPTIVIKNLLLLYKGLGHIDNLQYSSILEAIDASDLNLFKTSINDYTASFFVYSYSSIENVYALCLTVNYATLQEMHIANRYTNKVFFEHFMPSFKAVQTKLLNSTESILTKSTNLVSPQMIEAYLLDATVNVGFFAYFYKMHKQLLHLEDRKYFDQIFTQEPYKIYCDKALLELNKQYPDNKTLFELWKRLMFIPENAGQPSSTSNTSDIQVEDASKSGASNEMRANPFVGLSVEALETCDGNIRSYVGLFIDYLIYRGYIDVENKDAYVCCLCDDLIPDNTLEHLKYNIINKEGIRNANIVTLMFGRLTRFTANNQIEVNGREISRGSIYFNDRQINNGELEEWCLFWPFLTGRNKEEKEEFKKLFQGPLRSQDSKMENALKRVTTFIEDYEAAKQQNPETTKLDFIKMRHERY